MAICTKELGMRTHHAGISLGIIGCKKNQEAIMLDNLYLITLKYKSIHKRTYFYKLSI